MKQQKALSSRKATTFRLEPGVQEGLVLVGKILKVPLNRLVNEAVQALVRQRSAELAINLEETLKLLKSNRAKDADFASAITEFVDSEASNAKADFAEGEVEMKRGPVQTRVHGLLNA